MSKKFETQTYNHNNTTTTTSMFKHIKLVKGVLQLNTSYFYSSRYGKIIECIGFSPFIVFILKHHTKNNNIVIYKNIYLLIIDKFIGGELEHQSLKYINGKLENVPDTITNMIHKNVYNVAYLRELTLPKAVHVLQIQPKLIDSIKIYKNDYLNLFKAIGYDKIQYMNNPSYDIYKLAIIDNWKNLKYIVLHDREEIYWRVKAHGKSLRYMYMRDPHINLAAVRNDGLAIKYIKIKTFNLCCAAILQNPKSIRYIDYIIELPNSHHDDCTPYDRFCMLALDKDKTTFKYIKNPSNDVCIHAVQLNGYNLQYIKYQTIEICIAAIKQNIIAYKFIHYDILPSVNKHMKKHFSVPNINRIKKLNNQTHGL